MVDDGGVGGDGETCYEEEFRSTASKSTTAQLHGFDVIELGMGHRTTDLEEEVVLVTTMVFALTRALVSWDGRAEAAGSREVGSSVGRSYDRRGGEC